MKKFMVALTAENAEKIQELAIGFFEITGDDREKMEYLLQFSQQYEIPNVDSEEVERASE